MIQEKADPLWPVLLITCGVISGTLWLESLARSSSTSELFVAVPSSQNAISADEIETGNDHIAREALEPVNEVHGQLQKLARRGSEEEALVGFAQLAAEYPESASVHADYGYWLIRAERFADAQAELETAIALNPGSALLRMNLGAALHKQGKPQLAVELYQAALRLRPGYIEAELALAQALVALKKISEAGKVLDAAGQHGDQESRARALLALGRLQLDEGKDRLAHKSFERAVQWLPSSAALRLSVARAWYNKQDCPERAARTLEATLGAVRLAPGDAPILVLLGKAYELNRSRVEAADAYARAVQADPEQVYARRRLLRFALALRDYESAERQAQALLAHDDQVAEYHFLAGLVAARSGSAENARAHYRAAIDAGGGKYPEAYFNLGLLEKTEGKLAQAISMYEMAIEQRRDYKEAYNNLGVAHVNAGDLAAAREAYQRALSVDKKYASAWVNLGELFGREGNWAEAVRCLVQAIELRPGDQDLALTYGSALLKNRSIERAQEVFRRIIELDPRSAAAWAAQGRAELELGRVSKAQESAERALQLSAEQPDALRVRADVARKLGKLDEARTRYAALLDQTPDDTSVRLLLAQVFYEQGEFSACTKEVKKILRFGGDSQKAEHWLSRCEKH